MPDNPQITATPGVSIDDQSALQTYREGVESLLLLKSDKIITNGKPAHAAVLFEVFFKKATGRVRIFCRNLNSEVFDNERLLAEFQKATSPARNVFVDILVQETPQAAQFVALATASANVKLTQTTNAGVSALDKNFAVMDDIAIRIEPNRKSVEAVAIMYAPEKAKGWNSYFDTLAAAT